MSRFGGKLPPAYLVPPYTTVVHDPQVSLLPSESVTVTGHGPTVDDGFSAYTLSLLGGSEVTDFREIRITLQSNGKTAWFRFEDGSVEFNTDTDWIIPHLYDQPDVEARWIYISGEYPNHWSGLQLNPTVRPEWTEGVWRTLGSGIGGNFVGLDKFSTNPLTSVVRLDIRRIGGSVAASANYTMTIYASA